LPGKSKAERTDPMLTNLGTRGTCTDAPLRDVVSKGHQSKQFVEAKKLLAEVLVYYCYKCKLRTIAQKLQFIHTVNGDGSKTAKKHKKVMLTAITSPGCQCDCG